jgi:transcriptional regulator with XRE-family HTH domain
MNDILKPLQDFLAAASWPEVAEMAAATGVPETTIAKIKRGETENPRVKTVEALMAYVIRHKVSA